MSNTIEQRLLALGDELAEAAETCDPGRGARAMEAMIREFGSEVFAVFAKGLIDTVLADLAKRIGAGDLAAYAALARLTNTDHA